MCARDQGLEPKEAGSLYWKYPPDSISSKAHKDPLFTLFSQAEFHISGWRETIQSPTESNFNRI